MYAIPENPAWCSSCRQDGVCEYHRGPDGQPAPYTGVDRYDPSPWVLSVVGRRYSGYHRFGRRIFRCVGYDPRHGFWMLSCDGEPQVEINISERAIDRTFHVLRMTYGAWRLLGLIERLGRLPTATEADGLALDLATKTLRDHDFLGEGGLTDDGREVLARFPEEGRYNQMHI